MVPALADNDVTYSLICTWLDIEPFLNDECSLIDSRTSKSNALTNGVEVKFTLMSQEDAAIIIRQNRTWGRYKVPAQ